MPWRDRSGAFSPFKTFVLAALAVPALLLAHAAWTGALGPKPWQAATHDAGTWAIRLLLLSLLVTPARQVLRQARVAELRRMVGVACFAYLALHLALYAGDLRFDLLKVGSEIVSRVYLTIGFVALVALAVLAATSTDGAVKRLGGAAWRRLHRLVFPAAVLALVHFTLQSKADVTEPMLMSGLFAWLVGYRVLAPAGAAPGIVAMVALALGAAAATAALEFAWYGLATGIDPWRVLAANLDVAFGLRPALWVLVAGLGAAALRAVPRGRRIARAA
ncbi:ferric reductase-like transmembrane domain-containing protein [Roseomonas sp. PWR1]|uniref:Protein-methionine-sulfoxide reductase heme-binding subunit MsrQ n=1 Tax=Roseomonas nitratireducens TaxID=2820810 RepID=A0ABS4AZU2_9PROT|nr:ferric reductase-like transmembrane domain-containing protein [Neoroseomonas nitratireducens]MBP0466895.1 ferric reductase-like transmembrane domain-containing protein [Neoroseomonas nitratireducens]